MLAIEVGFLTSVAGEGKLTPSRKVLDDFKINHKEI